MGFRDVGNFVLIGIAFFPVHPVRKSVRERLKVARVSSQMIKNFPRKVFVFIAVSFTQPMHKICLGVTAQHQGILFFRQRDAPEFLGLGK